MASLTIGGRAFTLAVPADLDRQILSSTGLSLAEARVALLQPASPALLARAVRPLLTGDDLPDAAWLGEQLAAADADAIVDQIAVLYGAALEPPIAEGADAG